MGESNVDNGFSEEILYLTQAEVAKRFRVTAGTVKAWRDAGHLTFFQAPGSARILYPLQGILEFEGRCIRQSKSSERKKSAEVKKGKPEVSPKSKKEWRI
jgi:transposase-like protein